MSVCGLIDVLVEVNADRKSGAGIVVAVGYGSGTSGIDLNRSISSAAEISPEFLLPCRLEGVVGLVFHRRQ